MCPRQYPEPASPHLAAALAGDHLRLADLVAAAQAVRGPADLVLETAGGLLSPLTAARETMADLVQALAMPALLVSVPDLGTLNHTALTCAEARRRGIAILGLVVVHVRATVASVAVTTAASELAAMCALPVLAEIAHATGVCSDDAVARSLAGAVLARRLHVGRA